MNNFDYVNYGRIFYYNTTLTILQSTCIVETGNIRAKILQLSLRSNCNLTFSLYEDTAYDGDILGTEKKNSYNRFYAEDSKIKIGLNRNITEKGKYIYSRRFSSGKEEIIKDSNTEGWILKNNSKYLFDFNLPNSYSYYCDMYILWNEYV